MNEKLTLRFSELTYMKYSVKIYVAESWYRLF